jgi:glyceraldehyde 3-phosphate dehydrogenase
MTRVAINGFGRIGRNLLRAYLERRPAYDIIAVNDLGDVQTMAHLLEFDSVLGRLSEEVSADAETITVGERELQAFSIPEPKDLPWRELGIDVVVESTGRLNQARPGAGAPRRRAGSVVISAVANDADVMVVLGVNDDAYDPERHRIVSNASCTTNCVTPLLAKVLHDAFAIERGFMTTVHAYTASQPVLDAPHMDLRRTRAAAINLIPTTTGATRALGTVLPELAGRIDAIAIRAPIPVGSLVDLVVELGRPAEGGEVNAPFRGAADGPLRGILRYADEPLVSTDIVRSPYSCVFDSQLTMAQGSLVKVFGWYDNEWGYSCRLVDLVERLVPAGRHRPKPSRALKYVDAEER